MAERSTTDRGFVIYDQFTDTYGHEVRVVESSVAPEACCWIFTDGLMPHLNVEQAKRLRDALDAFIAEAQD